MIDNAKKTLAPLETETPVQAAVQPAAQPAAPAQPESHTIVSIPQPARIEQPVQRREVQFPPPRQPVAPSQPARRYRVQEQPAQPAQRRIVRIPVRRGPAFHEVDARMDDRLTDLTEAQKQAYWQNVSGTQVTWTGEVVEVSITSGGKITLKCNPKTYTSDTSVTMDGTQVDYLPSIVKGQRITVAGILQSHSTTGYTLSQGRIVAL